MWMHLANRQLKRVKGIFDRHPYLSANAEGNMNVQHTYVQGEQEAMHHEVMKQSTAVNHSQDSFTLTLTKLLLIDGIERPEWKHVWNTGEWGKYNEWKERNRFWWMHIIRLYNKWNISLLLHSLWIWASPYHHPVSPRDKQQRIFREVRCIPLRCPHVSASPTAALMKISCQPLVLIGSTQLHLWLTDLSRRSSRKDGHMLHAEINTPVDKTIRTSETSSNDAITFHINTVSDSKVEHDMYRQWLFMMFMMGAVSGYSPGERPLQTWKIDLYLQHLNSTNFSLYQTRQNGNCRFSLQLEGLDKL